MSRKPRPDEGFALIEVLVALTVLAVMIVPIASATSFFVRTQVGSGGQLLRAEAARALINQPHPRTSLAAPQIDASTGLGVRTTGGVIESTPDAPEVLQLRRFDHAVVSVDGSVFTVSTIELQQAVGNGKR